MSLTLKPLSLEVDWIGEPNLAFAGDLTQHPGGRPLVTQRAESPPPP